MSWTLVRSSSCLVVPSLKTCWQKGGRTTAVLAPSSAGFSTSTVSPGSSSSLKNRNSRPVARKPWGQPCQVRCMSSSGGGKRDFYDVLGVDRGADKATIKKAYFKLAKEHHPDANQGNEAAADKFKEVTEAYEILSDDEQRQLYDQFGHAGVDPNFQAAGGGNPFGGQGGFGGFNFGDGSFHFSSHGGGGAEQIDPNDLFDMFFGANRNRGPRPGADLQMLVRLTFEEAVFGTTKNLDVGYQHMNRQTGEVAFKERKVEVNIPPGIDTGMNLRLQGQGAEGDPGARPGNLLVQVAVDPHEHFTRDGVHIHSEVPISFTTAILGGTVDVKSLNGVVEMKIPKGCQSDTKMLLRGKGIREVRGAGVGNHYVHIKIEIPKRITPRQEELLREFDGEEAQKNEDIVSGFGKAAGSAFEKLFGSKKKDDEKEDEAAKANDYEEEEKKTAAS